MVLTSITHTSMDTLNNQHRVPRSNLPQVSMLELSSIERIFLPTWRHESACVRIITCDVSCTGHASSLIQCTVADIMAEHMADSPGAGPQIEDLEIVEVEVEGSQPISPLTRRRKKKATNMTLEEMVDMVNILQKKDYDCREQVYSNMNIRKDAILEKVQHVLRKRHGIERTKDQLRKRWSDLKLREENQLRKINKIIHKSKYYIFMIFLYAYSIIFECYMPSVCHVHPFCFHPFCLWIYIAVGCLTLQIYKCLKFANVKMLYSTCTYCTFIYFLHLGSRKKKHGEVEIAHEDLEPTSAQSDMAPDTIILTPVEGSDESSHVSTSGKLTLFFDSALFF